MTPRLTDEEFQAEWVAREAERLATSDKLKRQESEWRVRMELRAEAHELSLERIAAALESLLKIAEGK